ncbi:hypothetical protein ACIGXG_30715 [Streptomyces goshikiensis]|uniref:hypothetical protein n=1 Tax=Streptomyces goshikiensis TaxID=1942 RepID=UPI0037D41807
MITLIEALVEHGALGITLPACPFCERTIPLRFRRDAARCCRRCYDKTRLQDCSRCGNGRNVVTRAADGQPLCGNCMKADPHFHEVCRSCGQLAFTIRHDDQGRGICDACWRPPVAICSVCGNHKPCHYANSEAPRCANCTARLVREPCSYCGTTHEVYARTADGGALCPPCSRRREPCSICANLRYVSSRTPDGRPLCGRCFRKSPLSFRECVECGDTSRLHHFGLCPKCAAPRQLRSLLTGPDGEVRPELVPVLTALAASNPHSLLIRLRNPGTPLLLRASAAESGPVTHEVLDRLPQPRSIRYLRAALVSTDVLAERNELLIRFEEWVNSVVEEVQEPEERQVIRAFTAWFYLRRLRRRSPGATQ